MNHLFVPLRHLVRQTRPNLMLGFSKRKMSDQITPKPDKTPLQHVNEASKILANVMRAGLFGITSIFMYKWTYQNR